MRLPWICLSVFLCAATHAQTPTLRLWPGVAPGSEHWAQKEQVEKNTPVGTVIIDVTTPTLTAYLPERAKATGTAVIIAPGGAFVALAIDREGNDVARWLQSRGIAAFVLKYRVIEKRGEGIPADLDPDRASRYGIADAVQALKLVRQHAAEWGIARGRIGYLGFSAGAMIASGVLLQANPAERPDFAALVYGAPFGTMPTIPPRLPPVFMAWAKDDTVARTAAARFRDALEAAGDRPEAHIYASGGHGFGMSRQGTSSDRWIEAFYVWLSALPLSRH